MHISQKNSILKVDIQRVRTPKDIITHTKKSIVNNLLKETKNNNGMVQDYVTVMPEGNRFVAVDRLGVLDAALQSKQKMIFVEVIDSKYPPQITHLKQNDIDTVNPMAKAIAIRNLSDSTDKSKMKISVLPIEKYYLNLMNLHFSNKVEKKLVEISNRAIDLGIAIRPSIKFFRNISRLDDEAEQLSLLRDIDAVMNADCIPTLLGVLKRLNWVRTWKRFQNKRLVKRLP